MKVLFLILALISAPAFATYGNAGNGQLVAAHEQLVADVYLPADPVAAAAHLDEVVEMCNSYANQRLVQLNVHHANAQVVRQVLVNRRVAARKNVIVRNVVVQRQVVAHNNQVLLRVRAGNRVVFGGRGRGGFAVFNAGFRRADRIRAQRVLSVRVR